MAVGRNAHRFLYRYADIASLKSKKSIFAKSKNATEKQALIGLLFRELALW